MAVSKTKKPFKLNVLGLFKWESEGWTVKEVALILIPVMVFILVIITLLKGYSIPILSIPGLINKLGTGIGKVINSRSP